MGSNNGQMAHFQCASNGQHTVCLHKLTLAWFFKLGLSETKLGQYFVVLKWKLRVVILAYKLLLRLDLSFHKHIQLRSNNS